MILSYKSDSLIFVFMIAMNERENYKSRKYLIPLPWMFLTRKVSDTFPFISWYHGYRNFVLKISFNSRLFISEHLCMQFLFLESRYPL